MVFLESFSSFFAFLFRHVFLGRFFANFGVAVNKSAASAASPDGFPSRDQVGC